MKKMIQVVLVGVVLMAGSSVFAAGGGGGGAVITPAETDLNPVNIARAFALKTPDHYQCNMWGYMLISNTFMWAQMKFVMQKDKSITSLTINNTSIPLPEPIYGIPLGDGGLMKSVWLNVNAITKSGENAGYGYLGTNVVTKDDNLVVVLRPADLRQEIPLPEGQDGNDTQLTIEDFTYGYGYGSDADGRFYVYLPPVGGRYHYILRRCSDGTVIGSGWLEPFEEAVTPNDAYVGVSYLGNVLEAKFTQPIGVDDWADVNNVSFDCSIPTEGGSNVMGKVIFVDVQGGLEVALSGEHWVYIQSATSANGDMPILALEDHSYSGSGWRQTRVNTLPGVNAGRAVITIIPKPTNTMPRPWMNLHRFYGTPSGDGGMGKQ